LARIVLVDELAGIAGRNIFGGRMTMELVMVDRPSRIFLHEPTM
jgi:hypothetical protein